MRLVVFHTFYGCDTGCCGHAIAVDPPEDFSDLDLYDSRGTFFFGHPDESSPAIPEIGDYFRNKVEATVRGEWGAEHIADLDWEHSLLVDD